MEFDSGMQNARIAHMNCIVAMRKVAPCLCGVGMGFGPRGINCIRRTICAVEKGNGIDFAVVVWQFWSSVSSKRKKAGFNSQ
eukprot:2263913-Rhodomonas_salina.1